MQVHGRRKTKCALGQRKVFYWSFFHIPTSQNITAQRKRFYSTQLFTNTSFWARRENWGVSGELTSISGFSDVFVHVWYKKQRTAFGYRFCGIRKKKKNNNAPLSRVGYATVKTSSAKAPRSVLSYYPVESVHGLHFSCTAVPGPSGLVSGACWLFLGLT